MKLRAVYKSTFKAVLWGLGFALTAAVVGAQPTGPPYDVTLEARMAQSQSVVRGYISKVTRKVIVPAGGTVTNVGRLPSGEAVKYKTVDANGQVEYLFKIKVDELIRGPLPKPATLIMRTSAYDVRIEQWAEHKTSFLWFFGDGAWSNLFGRDPQWSTIRLGEPVPNERSYNDDNPVYLTDFTCLTNSEQILAHARTLGKKWFPSTNVCWAPNKNGWGYLAVPVTPDVEKSARRLIQAGDGVEGVKVLRHFRSAANIKLLKPLLNDTNFMVWQTDTQPWRIERRYETRRAAYEVLQEWGVDVPRPVMEAPLPWHFDLSIRKKLETQLPSKMWIRRETNTLEMGTDAVWNELTNIMVTSNLIAGVKFEWFVYPDGEPKPARATRTWREYWPTSLSAVQEFDQRKDGIPVSNQKYTAQVDFTLFETDNPPQDVDNVPLDVWRPEEGANYRVLAERTFKRTGE